mmetsp:Transcript_17882/g.30006  ORF Transcript_17882/g.30006 Transcript_17882/m.30006 type:complete len:246 (+) Transcript_17882:1900-2637(+)
MLISHDCLHSPASSACCWDPPSAASSTNALAFMRVRRVLVLPPPPPAGAVVFAATAEADAVSSTKDCWLDIKAGLVTEETSASDCCCWLLKSVPNARLFPDKVRSLLAVEGVGTDAAAGDLAAILLVATAVAAEEEEEEDEDDEEGATAVPRPATLCCARKRVTSSRNSLFSFNKSIFSSSSACTSEDTTSLDETTRFSAARSFSFSSPTCAVSASISTDWVAFVSRAVLAVALRASRRFSRATF